MASADTLKAKHPERHRYPESIHRLLGFVGTSTALMAESCHQTPQEVLVGIEPDARFYHEEANYWQKALIDFELGGFHERSEVVALFEQFNLPALNEESIMAMTEVDRAELADRFVLEIDGDNRPGVLMAEGCDFQRFGFDSESAAHCFGRELSGFRESIRERPFYDSLRTLVDQRGGMKSARKRVNAKNDSFYVVSDTKQGGMLRTHFEPSEHKIAA